MKVNTPIEAAIRSALLVHWDDYPEMTPPQLWTAPAHIAQAPRPAVTMLVIDDTLEITPKRTIRLGGTEIHTVLYNVEVDITSYGPGGDGILRHLATHYADISKVLLCDALDVQIKRLTPPRNVSVSIGTKHEARHMMRLYCHVTLEEERPINTLQSAYCQEDL